ncbi:MAG TPA: citrate synthase [Gammaproteobacteria bacterium]|nr:citrate synthase [Gammaproteobacteria bacterium]
MSAHARGLAGVPATQSSISSIDGDKGILAYRGYPIDVLAAHSHYEETALLLLDGELPSAEALSTFDAGLRARRTLKPDVITLMRGLPQHGHPMHMLQCIVASLGMFYPDEISQPTSARAYADPDYVRTMSIKIIARMPLLVAYWERLRRGEKLIEPRADLGFAANFLYMLTGNEPEPFMAQLMDACLILHAEHTINASTFAAMVTGSTLAHPYSVISAAIGALSGPLHGGANQRVLEMLDDIGSPDKVKDWLDKKLAAKEIIWGMGHREYNVKDPRAVVLHGLIEKLAQHRGGKVSRYYDIARTVEEVAKDRLAAKGVYPNVDFYSGILYAELGIPADQFTVLFAVARSAGWLAHWSEQIADNRIFRPTQVYTGEPLREYVVLKDR